MDNERKLKQELEEALEQFHFNFKLKSNLCNFCFLVPRWPPMNEKHVVLRNRNDFKRKKDDPMRQKSLTPKTICFRSALCVYLITSKTSE